jgi:hypothetical protein
MFVEHYGGGGELTTEAIINGSLFPCNKVTSRSVTVQAMEHYKDDFWVFGNFAGLSKECLVYAVKNLNYAVLEYDYKYCHFRSPEKHATMEGSCSCETLSTGKLASTFLNNAKVTWWMSRNQMMRYMEKFPFLEKANNKVLSSVLSNEKIEYINSLETSKKNDKWIILNSPSWIKGVSDAVQYAEDNNLEYELAWNLGHKELLSKLAESKGLIFFPRAGDTCPRMTIEAKLLDCELILNDNVQHKDEEWFSTKEATLSYLKERTTVFWNEVEKHAADCLNLPKPVESDENTHFKIITPFYNCEQWITKTIESLKRQTYGNFECVLVDDISTDGSYEVVESEIKNDDRFTLVRNDVKKYALGNIVRSIEQLNCDDEDVIILLDGDDWLASHATLDFLNSNYEDHLMTYGSYAYNPGGRRGPEPSEYPEEVVSGNLFRKDDWRASHLRSFKYKLWKNLDLNDLKDEDGDYYKMTYDQAIMLPLLEMAAERSKYIPEVLHIYNKDNPLNVDKIKAKKQSDLAQEIRSKTPYTRI